MDVLTRVLLIIHVSAGATALTAAVAAISFKKRSKRHNLFGKVYVWAMMTISVTAIPVAIIRPNLMLFFLGILSGYTAYAGWRFGRRDRYIRSRAPYIEWAMLLTGLAMIVSGFVQVFTATPLGWALVAFGSIGTALSFGDIKSWTKKMDFPVRIKNHLIRMLGGTIATVTAVLVQQVVPLLGPGNKLAVLVWVSPALVLSPLIFVWARSVRVTKQTRLFGRRKAALKE